VDGAGSGSCPVAGFGINGVEPSGSVTRELVKLVRRILGRLMMRSSWNCLRFDIRSTDALVSIAIKSFC
jgi:hypothetical protein